MLVTFFFGHFKSLSACSLQSLNIQASTWLVCELLFPQTIHFSRQAGRLFFHLPGRNQTQRAVHMAEICLLSCAASCLLPSLGFKGTCSGFAHQIHFLKRATLVKFSGIWQNLSLERGHFRLPDTRTCGLKLMAKSAGSWYKENSKAAVTWVGRSR